MKLRDQVELVFLRYRDDYYKVGSQTNETGAIDAMCEVFKVFVIRKDILEEINKS